MAVSDRIVVMNQGAVVQIGTAEDLYHRPASRFVAEFIGRVNLVPGRVAEIADSFARVEALGSLITARPVSRTLATGAAVQLVVRPEVIEFCSDPNETAPQQAAATVVAHTFLGEKTEYLLSCEGATLHAVHHNAGPGGVIADGTTVWLRFAEDAVTVLPEERS